MSWLWYANRDSVATIAYYYAIDVVKSRWPEAEHIIATHPRWIYYYARDVMESRWPEVEAVIATDDMYRRWYNHEFGTNLAPPRNKIMAILAKLLCMNSRH